MTKLRRAVRIAVPMTLIVVGYSLLTGCFHFPVVSTVRLGPRPENFDRPTDMKKFLEVGKSTRADVEATFGPSVPRYIDSHEMRYEWSVTKGYTVYPLCFMAEPDTGDVTARLWYDDAGILRGYEVGSYRYDRSDVYLRRGEKLPPIVFAPLREPYKLPNPNRRPGRSPATTRASG